MKTRRELITEIASEIVNDKNYSGQEWDFISVAIRFEPPSSWEGGVMYFGDHCVRKNPTSFELTNIVTELRDLMTEEDGAEWVACLIKISALTQEVEIDFEYDDVRRWYMTPTMDRAEINKYLMSLK